MRIALIQSSIVWENPSENRKLLESKIAAILDPVDLIILPEMFTSGFTMHPENVAEQMNGNTISWLKLQAKAKDCAITGSIIIKENNLFYNRMLFVFPDEALEYYDKKHLFSLAGEDQKYTAGNERKIVNFRGFRLCLQICYDLRFPVFARNNDDYDILIYCANWPNTRIAAWDILLKARAVENMCFAIGVNRIGTDGNNAEYCGHSQIVDFMGNYLVEPNYGDEIFIATLNLFELQNARKNLRFLDDRDAFTLH